jgi:hypothetical protein
LTLPSPDGKAVCIGFGHRGALCRWTTMPCAGPTVVMAGWVIAMRRFAVIAARFRRRLGQFVTLP